MPSEGKCQGSAWDWGGEKAIRLCCPSNDSIATQQVPRIALKAMMIL